jgi:H+-translocating NAD(P) transhydrogenase subunit beta
MTLSTFDLVQDSVYLLAAVCFVLGLHLMNSPASARRGNQLSAVGMIAAILMTFIYVIHAGTVTAAGWTVMIAGILVGGGFGLISARRVAMTAIPQLVSLFNAVGGGAAAIVALYEFTAAADSPVKLGASLSVPTVLDVIIGAVTFAGSLIASGKLQGTISGSPIVFPGVRILNVLLVIVMLGGSVWLIGDFSPHQTARLVILSAVLVAALLFGVTMVLPIGGADMPVVISLLNAFTGTAVAMAGFVIDNSVLIISGALVGASGGILTKLMADAMNRSIANIIIGGFGTGDGGADAGGPAGGSVREVKADDAAIQLAYASKVIIVPGYGLAAAQAQHEVRELADLLESRGIDVNYAIHPVAGRMPGHMNVLLAEANVPYGLLREMEEINPDFARADVALVIGANDVVNPAARRSGNPVSGMPILDVDHAKSVIVIKRSMGHGYAGIDNELYADPKTGMYFADAKKGLAELTAAVKTLVA